MIEIVFQFLLEFVGYILVGCAGPWRYLFSSRYRSKTHARWRKQSNWRVGFQILGAFLIYAIALAVLAFIAWVVAVNIGPSDA